MKQTQRKSVALDTVEIINRGNYSPASSAIVDVSSAVRASVANTRLIKPDEWAAIENSALAAVTPSAIPAELEVTEETTLAAGRRLSNEFPGKTVALNFASAKNPGGGFLGGARAQEESLARSSALYASLRAAQGYYDANRNFGSVIYTDHAILSPDVPVFRDDEGELLHEPHRVTYITMPAVNAGAMKPHERSDALIAPIMQRRIGYVLALAASVQCDCLILGAWGCGAFRNNPEMVASLFAGHLLETSPWRKAFRKIVFAVFDPVSQQPSLRAFRKHLQGK